MFNDTARRAALTLSCAAAAALLALLLAAPAWAAERHLYDPVLSLTGSTVVSTEDEVPDPGPNHPPKSFDRPCGTATDPHGDIYVTSPKTVNGVFVGGRIDVFNPQGEFLVEFEHEFDEDHCYLAVDSEGYVYSGGQETSRIDVFKPTSYPPNTSTTYSLVKTFELSRPGCGGGLAGAAVDPSDDHFYVGYTCRLVAEFGSAAEEWPLIREIPAPVAMKSIDVYSKSHDIYAFSTRLNTSEPHFLRVLAGTDGHVRCEVTSDELPFNAGIGGSIAVDQSNGDLYLYNILEGIVYQFAVSGEPECEFTLIGRLPQPPALRAQDPFGQLAVDAPIEAGEAGYDSPNEGYVYVTAGRSASTSHLWAFKPRLVGPPEIESQEAIEIGESEALLRAQLNPNGLQTTYHFEYLTEAAYLANGESFAGPEPATSVPIPDADAGDGGAFTRVSVPILGLAPDTSYRFRLVASNCEDPEAAAGECLTQGEGKPGEEGEDAAFATYPAPATAGPCPNEAVRSVQGSTYLPDCRAYELVTPPDTGGHIPTMNFLGGGYAVFNFATIFASPDGHSLVFGSDSGALPGLGGGGRGDTYEALRDPDRGWQSRFTGLSAAQVTWPLAGSMSADHGYSLWSVEDWNSGLYNDGLLLNGPQAVYLRVPAGVEPAPNCVVAAEPEHRFQWLACGSLGFDPRAGALWISEGGAHIIFQTGDTTNPKSTPVRLEPCAPPAGVAALYDRTPGGEASCISVPPAGASSETQEEFQTTWPIYRGANPAGTAVAFTVGDTLYVHRDGETVAVAEGDPLFAGISAGGGRVFYLEGADPFASVPVGGILACEVALGPCSGAGAQAPTPIGSGPEATVVNVSADGSHVYFSSPQKLDGGAGEAGKDNLYVWDGENVRFIATLDPKDLDTPSNPFGRRGLGLWATFGPPYDPSRSTADGSVFVFLSQADLTGQPGNGHWQLFRYDSGAPAGERLRCLSCNPIGEPAGSDARLETTAGGGLTLHQPLNQFALVPNLTPDGQRVFFESADRLVPVDLDGKIDVYEWRAQGVTGCRRQAGCLALISSGRSADDELLYAVSADGSDVFFRSGDTLAPQDPDATPSIYDARIGGGFAPPPAPPGECLGDACQPAVAPPEEFSSVLEEESGNPSIATKRRCPKDKRKVRRAGKTRCLPRCPKGKRGVRRGGKTRCLPRHPKKRGHGRRQDRYDRRVAR